MDLLIGLDIGTTATKALLFDVEGHLITSATYNCDLISPRENWVEQNPEDFWDGVVATTRRLLEGLTPADRVIALSISSQGGTTIPVDCEMRPLRNAISWMDRRAHEQAERIRRTIGAEEVYRVTGWALQDGLPLGHIAWLRDNEPELFKATRYFLFVNDFILYRLTGELCMDPSDAGITQLYNVSGGCWDERMAEIAGMEITQLSPIQPSGHVVGTLRREAAEEMGLPQSVLVVNGAHDQYCAALGTGVLHPGSVMLSCGTAWVILGVMEELRLNPETGLSISPHVLPDLWGALRSMGGVGTSMEWFIDNVWRFGGSDKREEIYDVINECARRSVIGSNRLIFIPLTGGHVQIPRGTFFGLSIHHSPSDLARAVMEGIAFELRWVMGEVRSAGVEADRLRMVGGAAESPIWPQIVADVTGIPVILPEVKQAAGCGAAILAGVGCGLYPSMEEGFNLFRGKERYLEPNGDNVSRYDELFEFYQVVFNGVKPYLDAQEGISRWKR
jgi:xylulokinase